MAIQVAKVQEFKGHTQAVYCICPAESNKFFYSSSADGQIVKWQINTEQGELFAKLPHPIFCVFYHENYIYAGTNKGTFYVFNSIHKKLVNEIHLHCGGIFSIINYKNQIIFGGENGHLYFYENDSINSIKIITKSIRKILLKNDDLYLACSDFNVYIYPLENKSLETLSGHQNSVFSIALNKKKLFSGGRDALILVWQKNILTHQIKAHLGHINDIQIHTENNVFATCSMDKTIKLWNLENHELLKVIDIEKYETHTSSVNKILWIDKNTLISCSDDRKIIQFNITL